MTNRERFYKIISGGVPDKTPFLAFSELIPHEVYERDLKGRGMGLLVHTGSVVQTTDSFEYRHTHEDCEHAVFLDTPQGSLRARYHSGLGQISGSGDVQFEWFVKSEKDYAPMIWALDHTNFDLDESIYRKAKERLGEDGVTHTWCDEPPYMGLQYLMGFENWALQQYDNPELFDELMDAYGRMQERRMRAQLAAPERDLINIGNLSGNYSPAKYARYVKPYFDRWAMLLRKAGCSVAIHADALNLREHIALCPGPSVNVVEAFTPPPVGNLSVASARAAWGPGVTLHINVPETLFFGGYDSTYNWTRDLLLSDPCPNKFLSFTEQGLMGLGGEMLALYLNGVYAVLDALDHYGIY